MEFITAEIPLNCSIYDTGDWHIGPHGADIKGIDLMLAEVADNPNARLVLKGDLIDAITTDDKRFCNLTYDIQDNWRSIDDHLNMLIEKLQPVKDKIICSLMGNHELTLLKQTNLNQRMCHALDIPTGGYTCIVTFENEARNKHLFKFLLTHGRRGINSHAKDPIQSYANMQASLKKHMSNLHIYDCVYQSMGHAHKLMVVEPTINREVILTGRKGGGLRQSYKTSVQQNADNISPESRWFGCSGSFLKTFSEPGKLTYAELAQYGPSEIGCLEVVVTDGEIQEVKKRIF
jgi:hypothetical protein